MYLPLFVGVLCSSLFWHALLYVLSNFEIILSRKRELVALLSLSFGCLFTVNALWHLLMVPCVGLQFVIVVFPYHTHLLFDQRVKNVAFYIGGVNAKRLFEIEQLYVHSSLPKGLSYPYFPILGCQAYAYPISLFYIQ